MTKLFLIFIGVTTNLFAQNHLQLIKTIDIKADFFSSDNLGNVYVVKGTELIKFDKSGKQLYKYSNKKYGNISFIDASNMLKILVFYKNFSQLIFLDNTLSLNGEPINLNKAGLTQVLLVCSSNNNGMWVYNQQNMELVHLNQQLQKTQQTGNLSSLLNVALNPSCLLVHNDKIYLQNTSTGILIFDTYGTY